MVDTKKKTKRTGRPRGSKGKKKPAVFVHPVKCPTCGGTNCKVQPGSAPIVKHVAGVLSSGDRFTSIVWRNKVCSDCGQHFRERTYQFDPAAWK